MSNSVTISQIAEAAGVSTATVDRVINGRSGVNPLTVRKVKDALATLGGAERQMASHAVGNLKAGNTKETLVSAMLHCYPYIGFPRISNAIAIIKEVKVE